MKDNQHVQPVIDLAAHTVTFKVKGRTDIVLDMAKLHPAIVEQAAMVGMAQVRIVDAAAVGRADDEGVIIPEAVRLDMKHANMAELVAHYMTGTDQWSRRKTGGGAESGLLFQSLARLYPAKSADEIRAFLKGKSAKDKSALLATDKVRKFADAIRAEAGKGVDAEALLAGLN